MSTSLIRGGRDAVAVQVDENGVRISLGPDGVSASVTLDFGEARLLAETILTDLQALLEVVLEVASGRNDVSLARVLDGLPTALCRQGCGLAAVTPKGDCEICAGLTEDVSLPRVLPDGVWRVVQDDDQVSFEKLSRRERDLVLCANPMLWPLGTRLHVKRFVQDEGRMETGFLRRDRGPSVWSGPDLVASFESFEDLLDAGFRVD